MNLPTPTICACGLPWGHSGKHAPHQPPKRSPLLDITQKMIGDLCQTCGGTGEVTKETYDHDSHRYIPDDVQPCPDCRPRKRPQDDGDAREDA